MTTQVGDAARYELRTAGHLDDHWQARFAPCLLVRNDDGTTTLTIEVADQSRLHGVLAGIRDIGVRLISLRIVDPPDTVGPTTAAVSGMAVAASRAEVARGD